ncbi:DUF1570 domain-containing protein [Brevundimonas sp.]|jgi:hypothetical protein|uniref:DUF1570 domain-containing protein n=1 Tax=Brevundimonas sp. TaxID=1871086 RepID=UPI002E1142A3|nr:DUF1570 domain-containing protein [Brevundimonas sp.]
MSIQILAARAARGGLAALWAAIALVILGVLSAAAPAQAQSRWKVAESRNFLVHSDGPERELRDWVAKLETFDFMLRSRLGLDPAVPATRRLPIYLTDAAGLRVIMPDADRRGVAGVYMANEEDTYAVALRLGGEAVLFHEYFHHFMHQNFAAAYPAWLVEGFAEYYSTAEVRGGGVIEVGRPDPRTLEWLARAEWIPLERLLSQRFFEIRRPEDRATFYPVSWLMTHWLLSERPEQMAAYMQAVGRGGDPARSLEEVTGLSLVEIERALRRHLRGSMPYVRLSYDVPAPSFEVVTLPASADDLLLLNQALKTSSTPERRAQLPVLVRAAAARHPDDLLARRALGHAELHFGDRDVGEDVLHDVVARWPDDVEALQLLAAAHLSLAEEADAPEEAAALTREARGYLGRANAARPSDYVTVGLLARSRIGMDGYPSMNDLNTWIVAVQLAPQLAEARIGAAQALMLVDRQPEAIILLRPLAAAPHGGGAAEAAGRLIAAAEAGRRTADLPGTPEDAEEETPQ